MSLTQQLFQECQRKFNAREIAPFGRKGAALAALGDMVVVVVFFAAVEPLIGVAEGVKLGDSTFNRFLLPLLPV